MRTLSGTALAQYRSTYTHFVYLCEIDADDADGNTTTLRYGSRKITVSGNVYADGFVPNGISMGWQRLRGRGGLASVSNFAITLNNLENAADLQQTYTLDNDPVRIYVLFISGAETSADMLLLQDGVAEEGDWDHSTWKIACIDTTDRDFKQIPTQKVNIIEHEYAPLTEFGKVIPYTFGTHGWPPEDYRAPILAVTRCLDRYDQIHTCGYFGQMTGTSNLYEWQDDSKTSIVLTDIVAVDQHLEDTVGTAAGSRISGNTSELYQSPRIAQGTNTVTSYRNVSDSDTSTYATVTNATLLAMQFTGTRTFGLASQVILQIYPHSSDSDAAYSVDVYYDTTLLDSSSGNTGITLIDLSSDIATYWTEAWSFEQLKFEIEADTATDVLLSQIRLRVVYEGISGGDATEIPVRYAISTGYKSSADTQNHVISGTSATNATSPVEQLAAVLTGKDLLNIPEAEIDTTAFAAAHAVRDLTHVFQFQLARTVTWNYWDRFCFEAGLHLFKSQEEKWKVIARDENAAANHYVTQSWIRLIDATNAQSGPDIRFSKTPSRDVYNEFVLRYGYNPMTGQHQKMKVRSAQYKYSGTCTVDESTATLTDATAAFENGDYPAKVGERIYIRGNYTVEVVTVTDDTHLVVSAVDVAYLADITGAAAYYGGPSISASCVRSFLRYKTINPLGGEYDPLTNEGGWPSDFIFDDDTADEFLDYCETWLTQRHIVATFATSWNALPVEVGDVCYMQCPLLPDSRDAVVQSALNGAINDSTTSVTVDDDSGFRVDDYIGIDDECVKVTALPGSNVLTVTRAQANTVAAAHTDNTSVYLLTQTWEVTGVRYDLGSVKTRLELTEIPRSSF